VVFERPFVKQLGPCYRTFVLSVCPVCNVCVLWPSGWMDQDETWHGGRPHPCHIALDGDPAPPRKKGTQQPPPIFGSCLLWPSGLIEQDETCHKGRPQPCHTALDGDPAPLPQRGTASQFSGHVCCGQMARRIKMPLGREISLSPGHIVLDVDPESSLQKGTAPNFWSMSIGGFRGQPVDHLSY